MSINTILGLKQLFYLNPDEERNWRAWISNEDVQANKKMNADLLRAIAEPIQNLK